MYLLRMPFNLQGLLLDLPITSTIGTIIKYNDNYYTFSCAHVPSVLEFQKGNDLYCNFQNLDAAYNAKMHETVDIYRIKGDTGTSE